MVMEAEYMSRFSLGIDQSNPGSGHASGETPNAPIGGPTFRIKYHLLTRRGQSIARDGFSKEIRPQERLTAR